MISWCTYCHFLTLSNACMFVDHAYQFIETSKRGSVVAIYLSPSALIWIWSKGKTICNKIITLTSKDMGPLWYACVRILFILTANIVCNEKCVMVLLPTRNLGSGQAACTMLFISLYDPLDIMGILQTFFVLIVIRVRRILMKNIIR